MIQRIYAAILAFVFPSGVLAIVGIILATKKSVHLQVESLFPMLPVVLLGVAAILGWRFHRRQVLFASILLGLVICLPQFSGVVPASALAWHAMLVPEIFIPVNLIWIGLFRDRGRIGIWCGFFVLLLAAQLLIGMGLESLGLIQEGLGWMQSLPPGWIQAEMERRSISAGSGMAFLVSWITLSFLFYRRRTPVESALLWVSVLSFCLLFSMSTSAQQGFLVSVAALILSISVLEVSYRLAYRDELTGLLARRALQGLMTRLGKRYSLAMVDVDHFKKFNDRYGHETGDDVLRLVASKLNRVGGGGKAYRYGGEEFTIVFPKKTLEESLPYLEELREEIESSRFLVRSWKRPRKKPAKVKRPKATPEKVNVTVSIGVAGPGESKESPEEVLKRADAELYRAKKRGRNRISAAKNLQR